MSLFPTQAPKSRDNPAPKQMWEVHLASGRKQYGVTPLQAVIAAELTRLRMGELNANMRLGVLFPPSAGPHCRALLKAVAEHQQLTAEWTLEVSTRRKDPSAFAMSRPDAPFFHDMAKARGDMALHRLLNEEPLQVIATIMAYLMYVRIISW